MTEVWKDIEGYGDKFQVSSIGRVRDWRTQHIYSTTRYDSKGYPIVGLTDRQGKRHTRKIHRLVALAFISNLDDKPTVNHINGIKTDNRVENLEWMTYREQMLHSYATGLSVKRKGVYSAKSKINRCQLGLIKDLRKDFKISYRKLGIIFNCDGSTLQKHVKKHNQSGDK